MHVAATDVLIDALNDTGEVRTLDPTTGIHDVFCDELQAVQNFQCHELLSLANGKRIKRQIEANESWTIKLEFWAYGGVRYRKETCFGRRDGGFGGRIKGASKIAATNKAGMRVVTLI